MISKVDVLKLPTVFQESFPSGVPCSKSEETIFTLIFFLRSAILFKIFYYNISYYFMLFPISFFIIVILHFF